ncbi:hypothetical protein [Methylobacterium oryzisoli]|uniref:hypothetical protein n=1 Tax=Methylobacterium oryzisoli TaxID=3385502 RepID=UPI0038915BDE
MPLRPDFDDAALTRAGRALAWDLGPAEPVVPRPLRRAVRPRRRRALPRIVVAAGVIALLSVLASERREAAPAPGSDLFAERAAPPAWEPVAADRYRIAGADETLAAARRRTGGGPREDSLALGSFAVQEAPFLRLTLAEAPETDGTLFVALARRAAESDGLAVVRTGERGRVESRFGPLDTLDATLSGQGGTRACTAFRLAEAPVRLDGWLCAPLGQLPEPQAVGCAVDRLGARPEVLLRAEVIDLLTRPERPVCGPPEPAVTAAAAEPRRKRGRANAAKLRNSAKAWQEPGTTAALARHSSDTR